MKKTLTLAIAAILVITVAFGAGIGTFAYYTKTMTSTGNVLTTANFVVNPSTGILNPQTNTFTVSGSEFAPGKFGTKNFSIDKAGTEVPVEYRITVTTDKVSNDQADDAYIFRAGTPVKLYLVDGNGNVLKQIVSGREMIYLPTGDTTTFGVKYDWPWTTANVDDKLFAADAGKINLTVEARQIKDDVHVRTVFVNDRMIDPAKLDQNNNREVEFDFDAAGNRVFTIYGSVANDGSSMGDIIMTETGVGTNQYTSNQPTWGTSIPATTVTDPGKLFIKFGRTDVKITFGVLDNYSSATEVFQD